MVRPIALSQGTALFLLCATTVAHADIDDSDIYGFYDNGCPKDTSLDKLLPHENCEQYYQCYHGTLIPRLCPNGFHFNADLEKCDWVSKTDCHKKRETELYTRLDKNDPSHASLICSSTESNDVLVAHKNCHQFYKCSYGRPLVLNCAQNLLYNTLIQKCDLPHSVNCGKRLIIVNDTIITTTNQNLYTYSIDEIDNSNADPSQAVAQCSARRSDGLLVAHESCNKFYKCSGGEPIIITCPSNHLYNPEKEFCDWHEKVDCDGRLTPIYIESDNNAANEDKNIDNEDNEISGDEINSTVPKCATENTDGMLFAHEICNHFYKCSGNKPVAFSCPGDLLFNSKKKYCDWNNNVDCGERIQPDSAESENDVKYEDPRQADTVCAAEGSDGMLVAHDHCNKYYKCHDGQAVEIKCPGILLYDPRKENCNWPTYVYCKDRTVPENAYSLKEGDENILDSDSVNGNENKVDSKRENFNLNNGAKSCEYESNNGKIFPHEYCNQFYKCVEGKAVPLFCPLNFLYNIHKQYCDWAYNVRCGNRLVPLNQSYVQEESNKASMACKDKGDGYIVPHQNCSQFYKCLNGQPYSIDCPSGLYFSDALKVCDWPMNVDCGRRLTEMQRKNKKHT